MPSEILRRSSLESVAPMLWRGANGTRLAAAPVEPAAPPVSQQLEHKFQEGRQRGLSDAISLSRKEAEAQLLPVLQRLAQAITDLTEARQRVREETATEVVSLSMAIASRILHRELTLDPDAIHGLLRAAFSKTQAREITRVRVHPQHEPAVRSFVKQSAGAAALEIVADPRLECGAILVETAHGEFDASIETQFREIERGLADRMQR